MGFISSTVDILMISLAVYSIRFGVGNISPASIAISGVFSMYLPFILLSIRRHDPVNSLYTGVLSGLIYLAMVIVMDYERVLNVMFISPSGRYIETHFTNEGFKAFMLLVSGIIGYRISKNFNRLFLKTIKTEKALQSLNEELEMRVEERTRELKTANISLTQEIGERKHAEKELKTSLKEKELLLKEIHQRVKNNLQNVSSFLDMSNMQTENQEANTLLTDACARIQTMSLIHNELYRNDRFDKIDLVDHTRNLVDYLLQVHPANKSVSCSVHKVTDVYLTLTQAIPCSLALNEAVSNVFKHAFLEEQPGAIDITIGKSNDLVSIIVRDNGIGIPAEIEIDRVESMGLKLIKNLVLKQLGGEMRVWI